VNQVAATAKSFDDARVISKNIDQWKQTHTMSLSLIKEAVALAIQDPIYSKHAHVILISGNLADAHLDAQADYYSKIAKEIYPLVSERSTEGIIAVMIPPPSDDKLVQMKESGISIVVFNLEVADPVFQKIHTPGKLTMGDSYYLDRLHRAIHYFGKGKVWCNLVLGLEPLKPLLGHVEDLLKAGIVPSYNILHIDEGSRGDLKVPSTYEVYEFTTALSNLYKKYSYKPYYCSLALRTSLTNESYHGRLKRVN